MKYQHYSRFGSSYFEIVLHDLHLSVKPSELTEMPGRPGGFCSEHRANLEYAFEPAADGHLLV